MKTLIVIPARFASQRYPGKPLAKLKLPHGQSKSLIHMTWDAARAVQGIDGIFVATDDERIRHEAEGFGADVLMTSPECKNGTERCADAVMRHRLDADLIINLQGDAPLTPPWFIDALMASMAQDQTSDMATPVLRLDRLTHGHFISDRHAGRVGGTTAVFNHNNHALYFSKEVLPYVDLSEWPDTAPLPVFHHVGVYAYRPSALKRYASWPFGALEQLEGLEQLRFLEHGARIKCVEVDAKGRVFWELNNPEDIPRIEAALHQQGTT